MTTNTTRPTTTAAANAQSTISIGMHASHTGLSTAHCRRRLAHRMSPRNPNNSRSAALSTKRSPQTSPRQVADYVRQSKTSYGLPKSPNFFWCTVPSKSPSRRGNIRGHTIHAHQLLEQGQICQRFWLVHSTGDRLYPYARSPVRAARRRLLLAKPGTGNNLASAEIPVTDEDTLERLVLTQEYSVRCRTLNRSRDGLYNVRGHSILRVERGCESATL